VPLFVISAALLTYFILNVIRVVRQACLFGVPLLEQQEIEFTEAGRVVLCAQGPRFSSRFAGLDYELTEEGMPIEGRRTLFPGKTSGFSWVRIEVKSYTIPRPGRYVLRIKGIKPGSEEDSEHQIVFMKPHLARSIGYVIAIILSAFLLIGSVVLFFLRLTLQDKTL